MEPILDETSLVPDECFTPAQRIQSLAELLRDLDERGARQSLRTTRSAKDCDIGGFRGLRSWCFAFSEGVDRDAGRLLASRLDKQPYIDGSRGLLAEAEGDQAIEARVGERVVLGLAYAALTDAPAVGLRGEIVARNEMMTVELTRFDGTESDTESVDVLRLVAAESLPAWEPWLNSRLFVFRDGVELFDRAAEALPHLRFGEEARSQITALAGSDPRLPQILRHLRALDRGASEWPAGEPFSLLGSVNFSVESKATLDHGRLGKLREFSPPTGFAPFQWSLHTKLAGGMRIYFDPRRLEDGTSVVLVGYVGSHLKTVKFG